MAWVPTSIPGVGAGQASAQSFLDLDDYAAQGDAQGAAIAVAVMILGAAVFLTVLKRSGFRAMVAVGR